MKTTTFKNVVFLGISIVMGVLTSNVSTGQVASPDDKNYDQLKRDGLIPQTYQAEEPEGNVKTISAVQKEFQVGGCLLVDRDASFVQAMLRNDDGSSGNIALPFNFDFYGTVQTSCFINNNGNVSFGSAYSTFTSSGFPVNGFPMLAPFWADVDTRNAASGLVWYKVEANRMIVIWENVGYYASQADKLNTFELIFTDGTDPLIGLGNTVAFCYDDMQWTTGSASGGAGGFGGTPATVGLNKGDGIDYAQIGRFGANSGDYDGPFGNTDGVNYLDCKTFIFNTSFLSNVPPIATGMPAGVVQLNVGDVWNGSFLFLSPEINQTTTTNVNAGGLAGFTYNSVPGNVSSVDVQMVASVANIGTHSIYFTSTDDFSTPGETISVLTFEVISTLPVAVCQDITAELDENGQVVVQASDLDNGSSSGYGIAGFYFEPSGIVCGTTPEYTSLSIAAPAGSVFTSVSFASYGLPEGACGNFSTSYCHSLTSVAAVSSYLLGNNSAVIPASNSVFGDPCYGIVKRLYVQAEYGGTDEMVFNCEDIGEHVVTLYVYDAQGSYSTCEATITVVDLASPVAACQDVSVTLSEGSASISPEDIEAGSTDNCGIVSWSVSPSEFSCSDIGVVPVTMTVTDGSGNIATCTADVTVVGEVPECSIAAVPGPGPYTGGPETTIYLGYGPTSVTLAGSATGGSGFTYAWSPSDGLSCSDCADPVFTPVTEGNYTFTLTVTNEYGCSSSCEITICVLDIRVPGTAGKKVYICHVPPGNPENPQTLSISVNAVPAHIPGHDGDHLGRCDQSCDGLKSDFIAGDLITSDDDSFSAIIYPNPFSSDFTLTIESESEEMASVIIYDMAGKVLQKLEDVVPGKDVTYGNDLKIGVYIMKIQQGNQSHNVRIVKQR